MKIEQSRNQNYKISVSTLVASKIIAFVNSNNIAKKGTFVEQLGDGSIVHIPKKYFADESHVSKFVNVFEKDFTDRKLFNGIVKKMATTDADLIKINSFAIEPLTREQVKTYQLDVGNTKVDRDTERISPEMLKTLAETLLGKAFMKMHARYTSLPIGRVYESWVDTEGTESFHRAKVYILASDEETVKYMDSGIWNFVSQSFTVPSYVPVLDAEGKILFYEFRNTPSRRAEALEVSLVYLGAQIGAQVTKSVDEESMMSLVRDAQSLLSTSEIVSAKSFDDLKNAVDSKKATPQSHKPQPKKGNTMKFVSKKFGNLDLAISNKAAEDNDALAQEIADFMDKKYGVELETVETKVVTLTTEKTALQTTIDTQKKHVDEYRSMLIDKILVFQDEVLKLKDDEKTAEKSKLEKMETEKLLSEMDDWKKKADKRSPSGTSQTRGGTIEVDAQKMDTSSVQDDNGI